MQVRRPGILFAMRYDNAAGYVWKTIRQQYELAAEQLSLNADCYIAYASLIAPEQGEGALRPIELDLYTFTPENRQRITDQIRALNVNVIVYMSALPTAIDLQFIQQHGVRTVNTEHDSFDQHARQSLPKKFVKFLLRRVLKRQLHTMHIANCPSQANWLCDFAQIPRKRMHIVMNGVDSQRFLPGDRDAACRALGLDPNRIWVMAASQARPEKRVAEIIHTASAIRQSHPTLPIGFIYVGGGEYLESWQHLATELGLTEQFFRFMGRQENLVPYYQAASLFVHAAERESFGLVLVEAMLCNCPVVATRSAGPEEIIDDGVTGRVIDSDNFAAFGEAIVAYVANPAMREQHARAARARALERYCIHKNTRRLSELIGETLTT